MVLEDENKITVQQDNIVPELSENLNDQLASLSPEEKEAVLAILKEYAANGNSQTLSQLENADWEEIPVDIHEFLDNDDYLGKSIWEVDKATGEKRDTLFPYWRNMLHKLFPTNTKTAYNTVILTGGIGLGKTLVACVIQLYLLYRMLCLKDPYAYYGMMPMDKITFSMLNVTIDAAKGVAWDKEQQMLQASPWFLSHGQMNASRVAPQWQPGKHIELIFGSNNNHVVGRALFCLDGETIIKTTEGDFKLKDLENNKEIKVYSLDNENQLVESDICTVAPTIKTNEEYEIELEDGSIIKCTPNHKFMLKDGTYKEAQYLTEDDELMDIKNDFNYTVYCHTNKINNKKYIGITCNSLNRRWQNGLGYRNNKYFYAAIQKYSWENFKHEIIKEHLSKEAAYKLEDELIKFYITTNPNYGYNIAYGGGGSPKYKNNEEKQKAIKQQNHQSYLNRISTPKKYEHWKEINNKANRKRLADPANRKLCTERVKKYRQEVKNIRKQLKDIYKQNSLLFTINEQKLAFGYKDNGSYLCTNKTKLTEILNNIKGRLVYENSLD